MAPKTRSHAQIGLSEPNEPCSTTFIRESLGAAEKPAIDDPTLRIGSADHAERTPRATHTKLRTMNAAVAMKTDAIPKRAASAPPNDGPANWPRNIAL